MERKDLLFLWPKRSRVFMIVSRTTILDSTFSTETCAPIYSARSGLSTEVPVGVDQGLKHDRPIQYDELVSLRKTALTDYVGTLSPARLRDLNRALAIALEFA
jgi:mRNA interferase MazF